jgi:hypothetical protein
LIEQRGRPRARPRLARDAAGRLQLELFYLPRWLRLSIALVVACAVVCIARLAEPSPRLPAWLPATIRVAGWLYLGLAALALMHWSARRLRR